MGPITQSNAELLREAERASLGRPDTLLVNRLRLALARNEMEVARMKEAFDIQYQIVMDRCGDISALQAALQNEMASREAAIAAARAEERQKMQAEAKAAQEYAAMWASRGTE
jgi:hypothetical protein